MKAGSTITLSLSEKMKRERQDMQMLGELWESLREKLMEAIRDIPFDFCQKSLLNAFIYLSLPLTCCHMPHT